MREVPPSIARRLTDAVDSFAASFDDLRMEDIAGASGIPRATLYYHFAGKEDILAFLFTALLEEFRARLAVVAEGPADPGQRLGALVHMLLAQIGERPAAAQLLLANLGRAGKLPDMAAGVRDALYAPFEKVLADGGRSGELRVTDAESTATALVGSVVMVGLQTLVTRGGVDAAGLTPVLCDLFLSGLRMPPPQQKGSS